MLRMQLIWKFIFPSSFYNISFHVIISINIYLWLAYGNKKYPKYYKFLKKQTCFITQIYDTACFYWVNLVNKNILFTDKKKTWNVIFFVSMDLVQIALFFLALRVGFYIIIVSATVWSALLGPNMCKDLRFLFGQIW